MRREDQRGRVGRWLRAQRLERGYSTQESARAALAGWGWPVSPSVYAEWESGSRVPSDENLARLQEFYGSRVLEAAQATDQSEVAAAIRENTAMLSSVLTELRSLAVSRDETIREQIALLVRLTGLTTTLAERQDALAAQQRAAGQRRSRPASTGTK